jgi:hypothetical protein
VKKYTRIIQYTCCITILLFVCSALLSSCSAHTITSPINKEKAFQEFFTKKTKNAHTDDDFFDFAIIWGTFEHKSLTSIIGPVRVMNPYPWYNETMTVIGYLIPEHRWVVKKACCVECGFLHVGFVGKNWLCIIGIGNIAAS